MTKIAAGDGAGKQACEPHPPGAAAGMRVRKLARYVENRLGDCNSSDWERAVKEALAAARSEMGAVFADEVAMLVAELAEKRATALGHAARQRELSRVATQIRDEHEIALAKAVVALMRPDAIGRSHSENEQVALIKDAVERHKPRKPERTRRKLTNRERAAQRDENLRVARRAAEECVDSVALRDAALAAKLDLDLLSELMREEMKTRGEQDLPGARRKLLSRADLPESDSTWKHACFPVHYTAHSSAIK